MGELIPGLIPTTMGEAMQLANMMADAKLVPAALQKSPADCLMVIQQAVRWEMDPFAVAQECSVIQGKLMHSGKLVAAVINARGNLAERLSYAYWGEGNDRTITVSGRIQGETETRTVTVRLGNAKTANKVWQTQPDQQLMYHGARVWARRHAPELMLGVYSPEEFDEPLARQPPQPAPNVMKAIEPEPPHDDATGEILEPETTSRPTELDDQAASTQPKEGSAAEVPASAIGAGTTPAEEFTRLDREAAAVARTGSKNLEDLWNRYTGPQKRMMKQAFDRRHKSFAERADWEIENELAARDPLGDAPL